MKAARIDKNQGEIIKAFERLGYQVKNIAAAGHVVPGLSDLLVARARDGIMAICEVKSRDGETTAAEKTFLRDYGLFQEFENGQGQFPIVVVHTEEDVARWSARLVERMKEIYR